MVSSCITAKELEWIFRRLERLRQLSQHQRGFDEAQPNLRQSCFPQRLAYKQPDQLSGSNRFVIVSVFVPLADAVVTFVGRVHVAEELPNAGLSAMMLLEWLRIPHAAVVEPNHS